MSANACMELAKAGVRASFLAAAEQAVLLADITRAQQGATRLDVGAGAGT
jgi:hypothetical protein